MLNRQKTVLCLLHQAGGEATRLQLVKWCFLLAQEGGLGAEGMAFYEFLPFHFGPYSFLLKHEIGALIRDGFVRPVGEEKWALTEAAGAVTKTIPPESRWPVRTILAKYGKLNTEDLLESVYDRYGWFTVNSKRKSGQRQRRPVAVPAVYTAGYEGQTVDGFLNGLLRTGVQILLDVRHNPIARRFGFHKSTLARLCEDLGIEYRHLPQLGVPTSWRCELRTADDYTALFRRYDREVLPAHEDGVRAISEILRRKPSVVVCMERDPATCHRSRLAAAVSQQTGLPTVHLQGGTDDGLRASPRPHHSPHISPSFA